ncbi:VOC family protein [Streptomyces sp. BBFR51]|uniref:VOC family protein n=1 Tax=Streptomyces sp. BBFR51 TaxID=3372856 RepID=UPI0037DDA1D8
MSSSNRGNTRAPSAFCLSFTSASSWKTSTAPSPIARNGGGQHRADNGSDILHSRTSRGKGWLLCPLRLHQDGIFGDELIQPLDGRSPYTEFLDLHGEGVHHLAYVVGSIDQFLEALRATGEAGRVTFEATIAGQTRFVYLDGLAHGPAIELIETTGEDAWPRHGSGRTRHHSGLSHLAVAVANVHEQSPSSPLARVPTVRAPERQPATSGHLIRPPCSEAPSRPRQGGLHDERHDAVCGPTSEFGPSARQSPCRQRVGARPTRRMSR